MNNQEVINVLKFSDRFTLSESIKAVLIAEKALLRDSKRKELIAFYTKRIENMGKYPVDPEMKRTFTAWITILKECESD